MTPFVSSLQRFLYSHYFLGGLRQAIGVLFLPIVLGGVFQEYTIGVIAAVGAVCVAIIDQPGSPRRYGTNGMLIAMLLGTLSAFVTGLVSSHAVAIWLFVPAMAFVFSLFNAFGKQGGLLGFACLLIMTLTMRTPLTPTDALWHTLYSSLGSLFYFVFSFTSHKLLWHREEQQTLSVALFATADYMLARSRFYDTTTDQEENYRNLIRSQAAMTEAHQAARDIVLRELPRGRGRSDRLRVASLNIFIDMVALLDTLVATHTDYATLRRNLQDSDVMLFARDALYKLAGNLARIALNIARNKKAMERNSVKAELRAIEFELETYRRQGMADNDPETYALLVQVMRRLRNASRIVERMALHTAKAGDVALVDGNLHQSLGRFLTRTDIRLAMLTSNLRRDSPYFRYAVRVSVATFLAMSLSAVMASIPALNRMAPTLGAHGYWIVLTIFIIMKPGFAMTRQRSGPRLAGTLIGCVLAFALFNVTHNPNLFLAMLIITSVLHYSLIHVNFMVAAIFNTIFVLLAFHFLSPDAPIAISERLLDTFIGCALALLCSYILPWWEHNFMASLAKAVRKANREYLDAGLRYAGLARAKAGDAALPEANGRGADTAPQSKDDLAEADVRWRLARKSAYIAFSNFAAAFYRMMGEPIRRQKNVPELNNLMIQNHVLASQISSVVPVLANLADVPPGVQSALDAIMASLDGKDATAPTIIETADELATIAYPLRQMIKAAQLIRQEMRGLDGA